MITMTLTNEWQQLPYTTGTLQNFDQSTTVYITDNPDKSEGFTIPSLHMYAWDNHTIYAKAHCVNHEAKVNLLPFVPASASTSGGGGGGSYTLPIASNIMLGGVKVGANLAINSDGVLSVDDIYTKAEVDTKFGTVYTKAETYTKAEVDEKIKDKDLPIASSTKLGGVKVGNNLVINSDGVLSVDDIYTKTEVDNKFDNVYSKTEVDTKFGTVYAKTETYNQTEIDSKIDNIDNKFENVYTKAETYTQTEVDAKISAIETLVGNLETIADSILD